MSKRAASNPLAAVAYLRVSTEDQKLGPEAQRAQIEAWAKREGVTLVAFHVDAGVSGGADVAERPALLAAIADLRAHRAGVLVVAKRDRIARDVYVAATIEREATKAGARILTADGTGNGNDDSSALLRGMLDVIGAHERRIIRSRTKAALAAKSAKGERVGTIPFGKALGVDGVHLVDCAAELAIVAEIAALRAAGLTTRAIAAELEARGMMHPRTGKAIGKSSVARMLPGAA